MRGIPVADRWWGAFRTVGLAEIFHVRLAPHPKAEALASTLLSCEEHRRADRFLYPGPRRRFILLRAALRSCLCDRLDCANDDLSFGAAEHGKPYAVVRAAPASIEFNGSDSGIHGLIAIAPAGPVGVDVEERSPDRDLDGLAETVFGPDEQAAVVPASGEQKVERFYRLWTIKEALVKALGTGLSLDVSSFQAPAAMLRGEPGAEFRFPQSPEVGWWVEDLGVADFAAAVAHAIIPVSARRASAEPLAANRGG